MADQPGPGGALVDEAGGDGICEDVSELVENVLGSDEMDGTVAARRPEVLEATVVSIEVACDDGVEPMSETREISAVIGEDDVVVIAQEAEAVDLDAETLRRDGKAVDEDLIDHGGWLEKVPPIDAATGEEIRPPGENATRNGHGGDRFR